MAKFVAIGERLSTTAPCINKAFTRERSGADSEKSKTAAGCWRYVPGCKYRTGRERWRRSDEVGCRASAGRILTTFRLRLDTSNKKAIEAGISVLQPCKGKADRKLCRRCRTN